MKEIYVFGAGASVFASIPLGKQLGWLYSQLQNFANQGIAKKFEKVIEKYFPNSNFRSYSSNGNPLASSMMVNTIKESYIDEILKITQDEGDIESTKILKEIIWKHIIESCPREYYDNKTKTLYDEFLINSLSDKSPEDITLISLNFDTLLKEYCINGINNGIYIDYLIKLENIGRPGYKYCNGKIFPLIKLHGSLDWAICQKCQRVVLLDSSLFDDPYNNIPHKITNCNGIFEPYIFVAYDRTTNEDIIFLKEEAKRKIKEAVKITIIGYSFPDYDDDVKNLFSNAKPNVEIEVIDYADNNSKSKKEQEIRDRYKQIFTNNQNIKINLDGFEKWFDK